MAIQGIITGFADPTDHSRNLILVGRGDGYAIIKNGRIADLHNLKLAELKNLSLATMRFNILARRHVSADWLEVREVATDAMGNTQVRELGAKAPAGLLDPLPPQAWLNKPQRLFLENYEDGEFARLLGAAAENEFRTELAHCGDGLVRFFIAELANYSDCSDMGTARNRLATAARQIELVSKAFSADSQWDGVVYICVTGDATDSEDEAVPGVYEIAIDDSENIDLSDPDHQNAVAKAALDCLHSKIAIGTLDDFQITALLEDGSTLSEDAVPSQLELTAHLDGAIDPDSAPAAVREAFNQAVQACAQQRDSTERGN